MRIIAISNYKGGVGKTTTAINLSYNLAAEHKKKVLIIDADAQGNTSYVYTRGRQKWTLYNVLNGDCTAKQAVRRTNYEGLDIIVANEQLEALKGIETDTLKKTLEGLDYDYIVIDCHPSMNPVTINALVAADDLIIPTKADRFSINGLEVMRGYVSDVQEYNPNIDVIGCILIAFRSTKTQKKNVMELVEQSIYRVCDNFISECEAVNSSHEMRKPLAKHQKKARATQDYLEFTKEYLELTKGE